jgi:hypothetical protein
MFQAKAFRGVVSRTNVRDTVGALSMLAYVRQAKSWTYEKRLNHQSSCYIFQVVEIPYTKT